MHGAVKGDVKVSQLRKEQPEKCTVRDDSANALFKIGIDCSCNQLNEVDFFNGIIQSSD